MILIKIKYKKYQRARTLKSSNQELWFLCIVVPLYLVDLSMKFQVDTTYSYRVMSLARHNDRQTDGQTKQLLQLCSHNFLEEH